MRLLRGKFSNIYMAPEKVYLIGTQHIDLKGPERLEKLLNIYKPNVIVTESQKTDAFKEKSLDFFKPLEPAASKKPILTLEDFIKDVNERFPNTSLNPETLYRIGQCGMYEANVTKKYAEQHGIPIIDNDDLSTADEIIDGFVESFKPMLNFKELKEDDGESKTDTSDKERDKFLSPVLEIFVEAFKFNLSPDEFVKEYDRLYYELEEPNQEHKKVYELIRKKRPDGLGLIAYVLDKEHASRENIWEEEIRKQDGIVVGVFGAYHVFDGKHFNMYERLCGDFNIERILLADADKI